MQQLSRCVAAAALALGTTGCATFRSLPLEPHAELSALRQRTCERFIVERANPGGETSSPPLMFDPADGLSEAEVVAVALTLNVDLRAKRLEIGEARALLITAGLWPNPEVGVGWRPGIGGSAGYTVDADLLVALLKPWERAARKDIAAARINEVKAEIAAEELALTTQVRAQWLAVRFAEQSLAQLTEAAALRQQALDLTRQRRQLGEGTELDVVTAELGLAEVRRDERRAQTELEATRRELNRLLGLPPEYALRLSDAGQPIAFTVFDDVSDEALEARVLQGRVDLRAKEAAYQRVEHELRLAVYRQYPSLKLGPSFGREPEGDNFLGVGASVELPLLNRNQGEIAEKESLRERTRAEYVALLHRRMAVAHDARGRLRRARLELEAQERDVLPLLARSQALFEGAFRARELNVLDWVTAQERTLRARQAYLESLVRYRDALIAFESATGTLLARPLEESQEPIKE